MNQIVDRVEIARPLRIAEAGRGRRDDLGMVGQQIEKPRPRRNTSSSMSLTVIRSLAAEPLASDIRDAHPVAGIIMPWSRRRAIRTTRAGDSRCGPSSRRASRLAAMARRAEGCGVAGLSARLGEQRLSSGRRGHTLAALAQQPERR